MVLDQYVWFIWAVAFMALWAALFVAFPPQRRAMLWASAFTAPFGLTEPLFVPEYWSPPSLFDLARTTGFDIESVIFCFGIGGVGAVLYNVLTGQALRPVGREEKHHRRHRFHRWALATPFLSFPVLYFFPWNPIYPGILAMLAGAAATMVCRPDLVSKTWIGGVLFLGVYVLFLIALEGMAPGYIARVWNLEGLSGIAIAGAPVEELLFAMAFGAYWSGVYEHFMWRRTSPR